MTDRPSDPRSEATVAHDIRPVVAGKRRSTGPWLFGGSAAIAAVLLFTVLDGRRQELSAPAVRPRAADRAGLPVSPPTLYIPPAPMPDVGAATNPINSAPIPLPTPAPAPASPPPPVPQPIVPPPITPPTAIQSAIPNAQMRPGEEAPSPLVIDLSAPEQASAGRPAPEGGAANETQQTVTTAGPVRVRAARFRKRPTTIAQGTLIPAVLETALDSTRPGQARALVSRDVHGYGGTRVLIPRGSRLYGEYRADLSPGQNRAFVQWSRLVRPDGVTIAVDSPAADSLGRSGIRGSVNTHFFERFGSALLQSTLNIATSVAASRIGDNQVIVALPNGTFGAVQQIGPQQQVQPTLKVRQGARISVFVARDLDFTSVERR